MSARHRKKICAYCGEFKKLTKDHVPPKLLLEEPYPPNLWTVPSCHDCNASFQEDDKYTRTALAQDVRASNNAAAQHNLPAIIRSLQKPHARKLAEYIASHTRPTDILGPDGTPFGQVIELDRERVNRTGARILRALYFIEMNRRLPSHAILRIASKPGLTADHPDMLTLGRAWRAVTDHRDGSIGTAFSYTAAVGKDVSFWLLLLYDYFFWGATIDERRASEREQTPYVSP